MQCNFHGKRVLVVEDNFLLAAEIMDKLDAANAVVLGPCGTLEDAALQVAHSDLAILDVDIRGRTSFELADRLIRLDVPCVFFTGLDRAMFPERFAGIEVVPKLESPETVLQLLETASRDAASATVVALIPRLRARARVLLVDHAAADHLVERTLQLAIADPTPPPGRQNLPGWLNGVMDRALSAEFGQVLN